MNQTVIKGYLCPKDGCGRIMVKVGAIETVDVHDGKPLDPPVFTDLLGCPDHGGRFFVNGLFLCDWDLVPE